MYVPAENRYDRIPYRFCGKSGLKLPALSLGLWHNFGNTDSFSNMRELVFTAFDNGITHFDLANNYGPPYGSAEENFGRILKNDLAPYRDELLISTKAGFDMWPGPYGNGGSRKYLLSSLDASLRRMGLDYVDIFYSHRFDPETPLWETMQALDSAVRQGKALYVGISNGYRKEQSEEAYKILTELRTPFVIQQPNYSMLNRWIETNGLKDYCYSKGLGMIVFSPLEQGLLTGRYLGGSIPQDSRMGKGSRFLKQDRLTPELLAKLEKLNELAKARGQSLSQLAISWILRDGKVTSVLIGASKPSQILDNCAALQNTAFSDDELRRIDEITLG